jgi:hypothetical protein
MIPTPHWQAGEMDWERLQLRAPANVFWWGIKFIDLQDLDPAQLETIGLGGGRPNLARSELFSFLSEMAARSPGAKISEAQCTKALGEHYPKNNIVRAWVREWFKDNPDRRLPSNRPSRRSAR